MKLSLVISLQPTRFSALAFQGRLEDHLEKIKALQYDGVELAIRDPSLLDWDELEAQVSAFGFEVPAIGTGQAYVEEGLSFSSPVLEIRQQAVERMKLHIRLARRFRAGVIIGLIRGKVGRSEERREGYDRMVRSLEACCELAEEEGVSLWIEPLNRYETDLINTIEEGLELLQRIKSERLGLLPDTFHMNIEEKSIIESLRKARPFYQHLHLADSNRWAPGYGHIDFRSVLEVLEEMAYDQFLSMEILPKPNPEDAARRAVEFLRGIMNGRGVHHE